MSAKEPENAPNTTSEKSGFGADFEAELDEAVRVSCEGKKMSEEEKPIENEDTAGSANGGTDAGSEAHDDEVASILDDSDLERAVKAGMSMSSVRSFSNKESFLDVVSLLESKNSKGASGEDSSKAGGEDPGEEDEIQIPDLDEKDGYDPALVAAFKALKAVTVKQSETIKTLKSGGGSPGGKDWIESKTVALGEEYKETLGVGSKTPSTEQLEARAKVKTKFDILTSGYKNAKVSVSADEVFSEALTLVVGNVAGVAADAAKAKALAERGRLALRRPSSSTGADRAKPTSESIERDIAEEINEKYFRN